MLVQSMTRMMESIGPKSINGIQPDVPLESEGLAKDVYDQMRSQYFLARPFVLHGEVPQLLAAAWAVVRETLFVGEADRGRKELIAWAVSQRNQCRFSIKTHAAAKAAAGVDDIVLQRWATTSTEVADSTEVDGVELPADLDQHRAEYLGTLTAIHYLNRMVSVFLDDKMVPTPVTLSGMAGPMAKIMMGAMIERADGLRPGDSLRFLPRHDPATSWRPGWAADSPAVSEALAGWSTTIEREAADRFPPLLLAVLAEQIAEWSGGNNLSEVADTDPLVRLATLTVAAPHQVSTADVNAAVAASSPSDTLALTAWAAQRAARQCAGWANIG